MKTTLEARKTFRIRKIAPNKVKSTNGICTIAQWSDNKLNEKVAVEAEHKKAEAITILSRSIKIR
jgi:hypothetical protein